MCIMCPPLGLDLDEVLCGVVWSAVVHLHRRVHQADLYTVEHWGRVTIDNSLLVINSQSPHLYNV